MNRIIGGARVGVFVVLIALIVVIAAVLIHFQNGQQPLEAGSEAGRSEPSGAVKDETSASVDDALREAKPEIRARDVPRDLREGKPAIDPADSIAVAKEVMSKKEYSDAIALLDEVIKGFPGTDECARAHLLKAICLRELGDAEAALAELKVVIEEYPGSSAAWEAAKTFAVLHFRAETVMAGIEWVEGLLEENPDNLAAKRAMWNLIELAARTADVTLLAELLEMCKEVAEGDESVDAQMARLALAWAMRRVDRAQALQLLEEVGRESADPSVAAEAKLRLATLVWWQDINKSVALLEEVLSLPADESIKKQARLKLAAWYARENVADALAMFDQVMSDGWSEDELSNCLKDIVTNAIKGKADTGYLLGWLAEMGDGEGKIAEYAMQLGAFLENPEDPAAASYLSADMLWEVAVAYMVGGDPAMAQHVCEACMRQMEVEGREGDEKYLEALRLSASALVLQQDWAGAADRMGEAIERFPDDPDIPRMLTLHGFYARVSGRTEEALADLQRVLDEYPDSPQVPRALIHMAAAYLNQIGDLQKAREIAQRIIDEYPLTPSAQEAESFISFINREEGKEATDPSKLEGLEELMAETKGELVEVKELEGGRKTYIYKFTWPDGSTTFYATNVLIKLPEEEEEGQRDTEDTRQKAVALRL